MNQEPRGQEGARWKKSDARLQKARKDQPWTGKDRTGCVRSFREGRAINRRLSRNSVFLKSKTWLTCAAAAYLSVLVVVESFFFLDGAFGFTSPKAPHRDTPRVRPCLAAFGRGRAC
jgi:hypothetical protein